MKHAKDNMALHYQLKVDELIHKLFEGVGERTEKKCTHIGKNRMIFSDKRGDVCRRDFILDCT